MGVSSHTVRLSTDGGVTFGSDIARGLAGGAQSFLWTVPSIQTTSARIRVEALDGARNQGVGESQANFSIRAPVDVQPPTVRVLALQGGEVFQPSQSITIQWQSNVDVGVAAHDVQFSADGGTTFSALTTNLAGSAQRFTWTAPNRPTTQGMIEVVARDAARSRGTAHTPSSFTIKTALDVPPRSTNFPGWYAPQLLPGTVGQLKIFSRLSKSVVLLPLASQFSRDFLFHGA